MMETAGFILCRFFFTLQSENEQERGGGMPRAPSEKVKEAEKLFKKGMAMVDIAKKLGVSDGTVRSWKNRYGWDGKSKKNQRNVAKKNDDENATLQKRKRGGQPNNKNAKGGRGNPHPTPPPDRTKHGGYVPVYIDALDPDEQEMLNDIPEDEELLLLEQIKLFSIRERRILKAINKYRNQEDEVAVDYVIRTEENQTVCGTETNSTNKDNIIARLEQELSTVQSKKTRAIEALSKIRLEYEKLSGGSSNNDIVRAWGEKLLEQRRKHCEEEK